MRVAMSDDLENIRGAITRENALALLRDVPCPYCGICGNYLLFDEVNNNGVGLQCNWCGKHHPFVKERIIWLRGDDKRRS
jgi:hypothetical protein